MVISSKWQNDSSKLKEKCIYKGIPLVINLLSKEKFWKIGQQFAWVAATNELC